MSQLKRVVGIAVFYLLVFAASLIIFSFIYNRGTVSGQLQNSDSELPTVYVLSGGQRINEMHGYVHPVDAGYFRDTMTAVGKSKTINISMAMGSRSMSSACYALYDARNEVEIESGDCQALEKAGAYWQTQIVFSKNLQSNTEYCLRIILKDNGGNDIYYYTRVRYGQDLKVAEKLQFVLDFNEATFNKDRLSDLSQYLNSESSSSAADYNHVDLLSSGDVVTWGSMAPNRVSDLSIRLKEINTETAAFTLAYMVEVSDETMSNICNVTEYYRLRWTDSRVYLLDFEREMSENITMTDMVFSDGAVRLGTGSRSDVSFMPYGTEDQQYCCINTGCQLFVYDSSNRIMTNVYAGGTRSIGTSQRDARGIKVMRMDAATGDLYFAVYGYIGEGRYEGQEGVLLYHFRHEDVMLEALMFLPYDKGFEQLRQGVETLSYMNDSGIIYLMIEDKIFRIDPALGTLATAFDNVTSSYCAVSDQGILVMSDADELPAGEKLTVIDLNTDEQREISGEGRLIKPLGFAGIDLVYGLIEPERVAEDSNGVIQTPVSELYIADQALRQIKTYSKSGQFILRTDIEDSNLTLHLGKAVTSGAYTDYQESGTDYIARNDVNETSGFSLTRKADDLRGMQLWLQTPASTGFTPISQTARDLDPGYDISKSIEVSDKVPMAYYVYTKGRLVASFPTIREAVAYANTEISGITTAGTIMTSHKQVLWQRAGRAYIWDLGIEKLDTAGGQTACILRTIADYEGWQPSTGGDAEAPLFAQMTDTLPAECLNISGLDLTDVLHFVYRGRLVAARTGTDKYVLITGFTNDSLTLADPSTGEIETVSYASGEEMFKSAGSVYYSYAD